MTTQSNLTFSDTSSLSILEVLEADPVNHSPQAVSFLTGLAIVISLQIGSGIFSAPSQISKHVPSPGVSIILWIIGGIIAWMGASCFVELGTAIPINGGLQEYLRYCYSDYLGFIFAWFWVTIAKSSSMGAVSMVFANHLIGAMNPILPENVIIKKLIALGALAFVTYMNCLGAKISADFAKSFLVLKFAALGSIIIFGLALGPSNKDTASESDWFSSDENFSGGLRDAWHIVGELVSAVLGTLFCYGGWETVSLLLYMIIVYSG
jgi:L-type amino acid transporter 6